MSRPGDWVCPKCSNLNYASREQCNIAHCSTPKPAQAMPPSVMCIPVPQPSGHRGDPNNWFCPICKNENFPGRMHCNKKECNFPRYGSLGFETTQPYPTPKGLPSAARPGDWICPQCNNHNYASREICNAPGCTQPKVNYELAPHEAAHIQMTGAIPFETHHGGRSSIINARPGDWICPLCQNHNYASREICNGPGCTQPKVNYEMAPQDVTTLQLQAQHQQQNHFHQQQQPVTHQIVSAPSSVGSGTPVASGAATPRHARPGDWLCPMCSNHNYASRDVCNFLGCDQPKPTAPHAIISVVQTIPTTPIARAQPAGFGTLKSALPQGRPGDWVCPLCKNHNYASREVCNSPNCDQKKADSMRWVCPSCGNDNFPERMVCNVKECALPRPPNPELVNNKSEIRSTPLSGIKRSRPGDPDNWICSVCGNENYPTRVVCNMPQCREPRDISCGGAGGLPDVAEKRQRVFA